MNKGVTILTILSFIISNPCSYRASLKKLEDRVSIKAIKHKVLQLFFYHSNREQINS